MTGLSTRSRQLDTAAHDLSRRSFLTLAGLAAFAVPVTSGCGRLFGGGGDGQLAFLSTQFTPVEEADRFRTILRSAYDGEVDYVTVDPAQFTDRVRAEAQAEQRRVSLLGALHGQLAPVEDQLEDVSALLDELSDRGFSQELLELANLGTSAAKYVPWMQATYVLAAHTSAVESLPSGADRNALTYDQLLAWAQALREQTGRPMFGLPAGPNGLLHRFLQGFTYPSFTGAAVTKFTGGPAEQMWAYLQRLWQVTNPASANFEFMQEPLAAGEVLLAWDHVARLVDAPRRKPGEFEMLPVPAGPEGRGYMPVVVGLAIPKDAPNPDAARDLIRALTEPETQIEVLRKNAFFPTAQVDLPDDLEPGIAEQAKAVVAQQDASDALLALPPAGLGAKEGEFTKVFKDSFREIVLRRRDPAAVLRGQAQTLQRILDETEAPCWQPDPVGTGACRVG
jgi:multiple sugar transport system substrate-binding protein